MPTSFWRLRSTKHSWRIGWAGTNDALSNLGAPVLETLMIESSKHQKPFSQNEKSLRIYIGPYEIAGYYAHLAQGLRELGVDCEFIPFFSHPFNYGGESPPPWPIRAARHIRRARTAKGRHLPVKLGLALLEKCLLGIWGITAIFRYDVFILGFGGSLFPKSNFDIKLLRRLGKVVIANLGHGSEARPPYIDGTYQSLDGSNQPTIEQLAKLANVISNRVQRIESSSSHVIGAPSTAHFATKQMVNWFSLGIPYQATTKLDSGHSQPENCSAREASRGVRILHSPSHPAVKGTQTIVEAIERLRAKGHEIEFVTVHGKPHAEVIRQLSICDFVVDQLYSDTPMAGFATEAAALAKPAVVGGYGLRHLKAMVEAGMWPPSAICEPQEIQETIERLICDPEARRLLGMKAQKFVQDKWSPSAVAQRYLRLIKGDIPSEWLFDPKTTTYLEGVGQSIDCTKDHVKRMVGRYQLRSLQLSHRPDLEQAFDKFIKT